MRVGQLLWKGTVFHFFKFQLYRYGARWWASVLYSLYIASYNLTMPTACTNFISCGYYYCTSIHLSAYISSTGGKFYHKTILIYTIILTIQQQQKNLLSELQVGWHTSTAEVTIRKPHEPNDPAYLNETYQITLLRGQWHVYIGTSLVFSTNLT